MKNEKMSIKLPDGSELIAEKETGTDNPGIKIFCKYGNGSYDEAAFAEYEPTGKIGKHLKVGAFNNYCDDPKYYEDFSVCVNLSFKELLSVYEKNCGDDLNCEVKDGMVSVYTADKELIYHDFYYDNHSNHHGHQIQLAAYKSKDAICNLSIECLDCNEVIYSVDNDEFVHDEEDNNCVYAVIQDWASDYELGNDMDLFSNENDAKNYFEKMIADDEESGIAEGIKDKSDFVSERSNDSYECYVEGYYCKDHYSIRIEKKIIR